MSTMFLLALPGGSEWGLILIAIILLFGARKIPELMKGIGKGMKEFKKATADDDDDDVPAKGKTKE